MKKLVSFFVFVAVTILSVTAGNFSFSSADDLTVPVPMKGKYKDGDTKGFLPLSSPFTVTWSDSYELAVSSTKAETVTLSVFKDGVLMEAHTFVLESGEAEAFVLLGYEAGEYSVVLTTPAGTYLEGNFIIE